MRTVIEGEPEGDGLEGEREEELPVEPEGDLEVDFAGMTLLGLEGLGEGFTMERDGDFFALSVVVLMTYSGGNGGL